MKINKIVVSYSANVQMRAFEKVDVFASADVQLDPGDKLEPTFRKVYKQLESEVEKQITQKKILREKIADAERENDPA